MIHLLPTSRKTILAAQSDRGQHRWPGGEVLPERVPANGLLIVRDGQAGELEVMLTLLVYRLRAEVVCHWLSDDQNGC